MSERVARRRAQTRERIFTEAMQLFVERGFDNVTVADITEAADIGKGTFFTHFPSKRDVFRYLGEQVADAMSSDAQQAGELRGDFLVDDAVNLVFGSYYTCCAAWVQDPGARSLHDRLDAMLDVVFQGLAAR